VKPNVYEFVDYKEFCLRHVRSLPHHGKGELKNLAQKLQTHSSALSQILRGKQEFTLDQGVVVSEYFGLTPQEIDYFLTLIQLARAKTKKLQKIIYRQLARLRIQTASYEPEQKIVSVSDKDRAIFYSTWYYSAIRLLTSIDGFETTESIARYYKLPNDIVEAVIEFLVDTGLCVREGGRIKIGPMRTHLDVDFQSRSRHHLNWRIKGLDRVTSPKPQEFFFSFPMCLTEDNAASVKKILLETLDRVEKVLSDPSKPQKLSCLNIDWFEF